MLLLALGGLCGRGGLLYSTPNLFECKSFGSVHLSRNFETSKIKKRHLRLNQRDAQGRLYHELQLKDRKGWQRRRSKHGSQSMEEDLEGALSPLMAFMCQIKYLRFLLTIIGRTYKLYDIPHMPHVNVYHHLAVWCDYLERNVYCRPLQDDDFIFPSIGSGGAAQDLRQISADDIQKLINEFATKSGLYDNMASDYRFTTHCFRRGGAQYWFMYAPESERWTLSIIRWWGGWAEGESVSLF